MVYLVGIPWMALVAHLGLGTAVLGSAAYLPGDVTKSVIAALAAVTVRKAYPLIEVEHQS